MNSDYSIPVEKSTFSSEKVLKLFLYNPVI